LLLHCPSKSIAASFDCSKAATKVEKMICGDAHLSRLDDDLGRNYSNAMKKFPNTDQLKQEQRAWLKEREKCKNVECLDSEYRERIHELIVELEPYYDPLQLDKTELYNFAKLTSEETIGSELEVDLNDDGKDEYLAGALCGNGGCEYHYFMNLGNNKYKYLGVFDLHRMGFEILKAKHNGFNDIWGYWHGGGGIGYLTRYEFNGQEYSKKASVEVNENVFDLLRSEYDKGNVKEVR
jgi:uncharacterized protein YecT (DUF1311 family)